MFLQLKSERAQGMTYASQGFSKTKINAKLAGGEK